MEHLYDQMAFLRRSASEYDRGEFNEAKRLATTLRVLLHDSPTSHSLLKQLGLKNKLRFLDTAGNVAPNTFERLLGGHFRATIGIATPLAPMAWGPWGWRFIARLDDHQTQLRSLRFHKWWDNFVVSIPPDTRLSRRDLVLWVANQDGGAHIDPSLKARFAGVARQQFIRGSNDKPLAIATIERPERKGPANPALPMVRQITYEVTKTLEGRLENLT